MKYYSGIGSRETPTEICAQFTDLAVQLEKLGYVLRSGGANGADLAFEKGVQNSQNKQIYLPWKGFNGSNSNLYNISKEALVFAARMHPAWQYCSFGAKNLHARNGYQVLGQDLDLPVNFIICWTENGKRKGGTAQALRIADIFGIPIFDFGLRNYSLEEIINVKIPIVNSKRENGDVYCGRPSKFGNPFEIGKDGSRLDVVLKYYDWIQTQEELMAEIPLLENKIMSCWCTPKLCHCNILLGLLNNFLNTYNNLVGIKP